MGKLNEKIALVTGASKSIGAEAEPCSHIHQVGQGVGLHFLHHLASVCLHRDFADTEIATDLFIQQACHHQGHHLPFATAKRSVAVPECSHLGRQTKRSFAALDGLPDGAQQHVIAKWLRKELHSSRLHRLDSLRHIAVARNEDDRHVRPFDGDLLLQVETVDTRKRNVEYKAARNQGSRAGKEF